MRVELVPAEASDATQIALLRNASANDLTTRHGPGFWSAQCTELSPLRDYRAGGLYVARQASRLVASLHLATKKPWAIDRTYFTAAKRPLYLLSMVVAPGFQRRGIGRSCLEQAAALARKFPADAIWLDAFDHAAGAGDFYRKCGCRERGRVVYRGVPLIYFEIPL